MNRKIRILRIAGALLAACLLVGGCENNRREARQELIEEMAQRQTARQESRALYQEAMSEYRAGLIEDARRLLRESVEADSRNAPAWVAMGVLEYENNNLFEAADAFGRALRLEPRRVEPHYNMGLVYETAGKYSQAVESYEKALELAPDEPTVMENLIRCYIKTDHPREALRLIDGALLLEQRPPWREWLELQKFRLLQES